MRQIFHDAAVFILDAKVNGHVIITLSTVRRCRRRRLRRGWPRGGDSGPYVPALMYVPGGRMLLPLPHQTHSCMFY